MVSSMSYRRRCTGSVSIRFSPRKLGNLHWLKNLMLSKETLWLEAKKFPRFSELHLQVLYWLWIRRLLKLLVIWLRTSKVFPNAPPIFFPAQEVHLLLLPEVQRAPGRSFCSSLYPLFVSLSDSVVCWKMIRDHGGWRHELTGIMGRTSELCLVEARCLLEMLIPVNECRVVTEVLAKSSEGVR